MILNYEIFVDNNIEKIDKSLQSKIKESKIVLNANLDKIEALSPINILKNGYAIITSNDKNIKSSRLLKKDDEINIKFYDGDKKAKIIE